MFARLVVTALVVLAAAAPAGAGQQENLQVFRDVQKQVLHYPHFTIFDSVNAQIDNGTVTLTGKVTMPYKTQRHRAARAQACRRCEQVVNRSRCCRCRSSTTTCASASRARSTPTRTSGRSRRW